MPQVLALASLSGHYGRDITVPAVVEGHAKRAFERENGTIGITTGKAIYIFERAREGVDEFLVLLGKAESQGLLTPKPALRGWQEVTNASTSDRVWNVISADGRVLYRGAITGTVYQHIDALVVPDRLGA